MNKKASRRVYPGASVCSHFNPMRRDKPGGSLSIRSILFFPSGKKQHHSAENEHQTAPVEIDVYFSGMGDVILRAGKQSEYEQDDAENGEHQADGNANIEHEYFSLILV
jgi:hypothetical protein